MWLAEGVGILPSVSHFPQLDLCLAGWGRAITLVVSESLDLELEETSSLIRKSKPLSRWFRREPTQKPPLHHSEARPPCRYRSRIREGVGTVHPRRTGTSCFHTDRSEAPQNWKVFSSCSLFPIPNTPVSPQPSPRQAWELNWLILYMQVSTGNIPDMC